MFCTARSSYSLNRRKKIIVVPIDSSWMEHSLVSGSQAGFPRQQSQSGSLPRAPVEVGRFHALVHQNGAGNSAVFVGNRGFRMKAPLQIKVLGERRSCATRRKLSCLRQRRLALCSPTWLWPTGDNVATIYANCSGTCRTIPELRSGGASRSLGGCSTKTVTSPASGPTEAACFSTPTSLMSICCTSPTLQQKTCALLPPQTWKLGPPCSEAASSKVLNFVVAQSSRLGAPSKLMHWIAPDR